MKSNQHFIVRFWNGYKWSVVQDKDYFWEARTWNSRAAAQEFADVHKPQFGGKVKVFARFSSHKKCEHS